MLEFDLAVTFDLLTSISNQSTFVPNCNKVVNLAKFPQEVCRILSIRRHAVLVHDRARKDAHTDNPKTAANQQQRHKKHSMQNLNPRPNRNHVARVHLHSSDDTAQNSYVTIIRLILEDKNS